jgi:hypothetical protein
MAEITKFAGDIFWVEYDTENSIDDPYDELDCVGDGVIVEFEQALRLPNFFGVVVNDEPKYFETKAEAEAAALEEAS